MPTVIVTGGARGIGAATARLAAARGWSVCVNDRASASPAAALVEAIRTDGGEAIAVVGEGIRVDGVRPGLTATGIHADSDATRLHRPTGRVPMRRVGDADEVAAAIVWLLSAEASSCTGTTIDVRGGR